MRISLCFLLALLSAPLHAADPLEDLKQFYRGVDALAGDFEQRLLDEDGDTLERFAGRFWMQRPGKFLWLYDTPYEQQLGSDGDTLWYYDVDLRQINLRDAKQSLSGTPAELLGGDLQQLQAYDIKALAAEDELQWLQLKPREDDADFEDIRIGLVKGQPARIRLVDRLGQVTVMQLHDLSANPQIQPQRLQLVIPEKVTVVDERAPN